MWSMVASLFGRARKSFLGVFKFPLACCRLAALPRTHKPHAWRYLKGRSRCQIVSCLGLNTLRNFLRVGVPWLQLLNGTPLMLREVRNPADCSLLADAFANGFEVHSLTSDGSASSDYGVCVIASKTRISWSADLQLVFWDTLARLPTYGAEVSAI